MPGVIIDLDIKVPKGVAAIRRLERVGEKLDKTLEKISNALAVQATQVNQIASGYGRVASQANRAASATRKVKAPPILGFGDPQGVINRYSSGVASGDPFAVRMVNRAQSQLNAQKRAQRAVQGPGDPYMTALMRTRFTKSVFGQIGHPLGIDLAQFGGDASKMAGLNGPGSANISKIAGTIGRLAGPMALLTAGIWALKMSINDMNVQRGFNVRHGGSLGSSRSAMLASGVTGASVESVMGGVGGGGIAGSIAAKYGVNPVRGYYGDIDDSGAFVKLARAIGNLPYNQARREAIGLGSPELANMALLTGGTRERLLKSRSGMNDPENLRASAEFAANIEIIKADFMKIVNSGAAPVLRTVANSLRLVTMQFETLSNILEFVGNSSGLNAVNQAFENLFGGEKAGKSKEKVFNDSVDKFARTVDGMQGGGPRANGAIPDSMHNKPVDEAQRAHHQRKVRTGLL